MIITTRENLTKLLHAATNNIKDFVSNNDQFINENLDTKVLIWKKDSNDVELAHRDNIEIWVTPDGKVKHTGVIIYRNCSFGILFQFRGVDKFIPLNSYAASCKIYKK